MVALARLASACSRSKTCEPAGERRRQGPDTSVSAGSSVQASGRGSAPDDVQQLLLGEADQRARAAGRPERGCRDGSARTRVRAMRSWISWRRKNPLPAWVATGMP